jgi:two-component sensor histidine kinase
VPKTAAKYAKKASEQLIQAADNLDSAAREGEIGRDEAAIQQAQTASSHIIRARTLADKALKADVEHIQLRMREVGHRNKNMLSLVEAIARQTAAHEPEDFIGHFSVRIQALAVNQDLLVLNEWQGVDVEDLVRAQLAPFGGLLGSRIALRGPKLRLKATTAQAIGLALHELATNAGKYGALSTDAGRVDVSWRVRGDTFTLGWTEREGPSVSAPKRRGFGTIVFEAMVERRVDGKVDLHYAPSGLTWQLACPAANALEPREREPNFKGRGKSK